MLAADVCEHSVCFNWSPPLQAPLTNPAILRKKIVSLLQRGRTSLSASMSKVQQLEHTDFNIYKYSKQPLIQETSLSPVKKYSRLP